MIDLESKPNILCPVLDEQGIKVIPYWFKTQGKGAEGPVLLLVGVPIGYNTALSANGFSQRPEGWLVDATGKKETFWTQIFGKIEFSQKKPVAVHEPKQIIFAPPPVDVKTIIESFSDEALEAIGRKDSLHGKDRLRLVQRDAAKGAVNCAGSWSIIKSACITRLENNPEDVSAFEYAWTTARAHSLETTGLLNRISHELLLTKIVERRRITAQMEAVVPNYYRMGKSQSFIAKVDWKARLIFSGSFPFGPIELTKFNEVDLIARYLIDSHAKPIEDSLVIEQMDERVAEHIGEASGIEDWAEFEVPDVPNISHVPSSLELTSKPSGVSPKTTAPVPKRTSRLDISTTLSSKHLIERLVELEALSEKRVAYSRVMSRKLFERIVYGGDVDITRSSTLEALESLLAFFSSAINEETLDKCWEYKQDSLRKAIATLTLNSRLDLFFTSMFFDAETNRIAIDNLLTECQGERRNWWWNGFAIDKDPTGKWELYKVTKGVCRKFKDMSSDSVKHLDDYLYNQSRQRRMLILRPSLKATIWRHVYQSASGNLLQLSETYLSEREANSSLQNSYLTYRETPRFPELWTKETDCLTKAEIDSEILSVWHQLKLNAELISNENAIQFVESSAGVYAYYNHIQVGECKAGNVGHVVGLCLYNHFLKTSPTCLDRVVASVLERTQASDLDFDIEEDLLSEINTLDDLISKSLGIIATQTLRECIRAPSPTTESSCLNLLLLAKKNNIGHEVVQLIQSVLTVSAQYAPYKLSSDSLKCKVRASLTTETVMAFVFAQYFGLRLSWMGKKIPRLFAGYLAGDCIGGELYLSGEQLLNTIRLVDDLMTTKSEKQYLPDQLIAAEQMSLI